MRNHRRHLMSRIPNPASRIPMLAGVAIALGACATLGKLYFQDPQIQLQEINVTSLGLSGGTMDLVFDVYNPNDYRIRSTRIEVGVDLESTHFGDAYLERPLDLSPTNHSRVVVPVRFEWAGVGAGARALLTKQAINYALTGRVILDTPLGDKRVGLTGRGQVPLKKLF
ncbi:MAG: hypothetical protein DMD37_08605 [Gemmatimonadetes bacterium]|nr:MAG: hypothetical protein DMD37_08605 [Gemmatimonadota bacterium]